MKQKSLLTITLLGGALAGVFLGLGATRLTPTAKAAGAKEAAMTAPGGTAVANTFGDAFSGKTYPLTLAAEKIDASYHLVALVDEQDKVSQVATRGETFTAGGEMFLVCYDVPLTTAQTRPPQPKAGATGNVLFVNTRSIQAMAGILPITSADTPAPTPAVP